MRGVCGRLREVVAYESPAAEGLLQEEVQSHLLFCGENVLCGIFRLQ